MASSQNDPRAPVAENLDHGGRSDGDGGSGSGGSTPRVESQAPKKPRSSGDNTDETKETIVTEAEKSVEGGTAAETAVKNITVAISQMAKCVKELPLQNLNTAVDLFREVYDDLPAWQSLRYDAYNDLALALGVRFVYAGKIDDYIEFFKLLQYQLRNVGVHRDERSNVLSIMDELSESGQKAFKSAHQVLAEFHKLLPGSIVNEVIDLLQPSIEVLQAYGSEANEIRSIALFTLAKAQYARHHLSDDASDLLDATSSLTEIINNRPERDVPHPRDYTIDGVFYVMMFERSRLNYDEEIANLLQDTEQKGKGKLSEVLGTEGKDDPGSPTQDQAGTGANVTTGIELHNAGIMSPMKDPEHVIDTELYRLQQNLDTIPTHQTLEGLGSDQSASVIKAEQLDEETLLGCIIFAGSLLAACKVELPLEALDATIRMFRQVLQQCPNDSATLRDLGFALSIKYMHTGDAKVCMESMRLLCTGKNQSTNVVTEASGRISGSEFKVNIKAALAKASLARFHESLSLSTLNTVVFFFSWLTICTDETHPLRIVVMVHLADSLFMRFQHARHQDDLRNAITFLQHARTHPVAQRTFYLRHHIFFRLFVMTMTHADLSGDMDEFRDVLVYVKGMEQELKSPSTPLSDPNSFIMDSAYNHALDSDNMDLLNKEILHRRDTLARSIVSTSFYRQSVANLGYLLSFRFGEQNQRSDLDEAILWANLTLDLTPQADPERPVQLKSLARVLSDRFREDNQRNDLHEAVRLMKECLDATPPIHPLRWEFLVEMGQILTEQFEHEGNHDDLEEVIRLQRQAQEVIPQGSAGQHILLNTLGFALAKRFEYGSGPPSDLDEVTVILRKALELTPPKHRGRLQSLCNFASVLFLRFYHTNQPRYLDDAIRFREEAMLLVSHPGNPTYHSLIENLSMLLSTRFRSRSQQSDIDRAILLAEQALEMTPPTHSKRPWVMMRLATRLMVRADRWRGEGQRHINRSIEYGMQAVKQLNSLGETHFYKPILLINLSSALCIRWEIESDRRDLDESIKVAQEAVSLIPTDHPQHAICLHQLGDTLAKAYSSLSEKRYLEDAIDAFRRCLKSPSISATLRFGIATKWATTADDYYHPSAIEAYDLALQLLPQTVSYNLDIHSRQEVLASGPIDGVARRASKCAIRKGLYGKAVEYLEAGRAVFWGQFQRLRLPLDELRNKNAKLASTFHTLSSELERGSHRSKAADPFDVSKNLALENESSRLSRLNEELTNVLDEIREIPGLENFLKPRSLEALQAAAVDGPIAFLIPNNDESHCIVMTSKSVFHVSIPKFDTQTLASFVEWLRLAISQSRVQRSSSELDDLMEDAVGVKSITDRLKGRRVGPLSDVSSDSIFRSILTCLWGYIVEPILKRLSIKKSLNRPTIRWCPTGLFTFLPIHAAGCYLDGLPEESASDYIISSYTPTVEELLPRNNSNTPDYFKMLVVAHNNLYFVEKEVQLIEKQVPNTRLVKLGIANSNTPARVDDVVFHLSTASVVHFACHGVQDRIAPLSSALLVGEERKMNKADITLSHEKLTIEEIMKYPLPNGSLAFLCACETAMGDDKLPDEAMSLGGSLLFSGFRSVVATMWRMADYDGPMIADIFYEVLFQTPGEGPALRPDLNKSAVALDMAVRKLRSSGVEFRRWVPFIHLGK